MCVKTKREAVSGTLPEEADEEEDEEKEEEEEEDWLSGASHPGLSPSSFWRRACLTSWASSEVAEPSLSASASSTTRRAPAAMAPRRSNIKERGHGRRGPKGGEGAWKTGRYGRRGCVRKNYTIWHTRVVAQTRLGG